MVKEACGNAQAGAVHWECGMGKVKCGAGVQDAKGAGEY